MRSTVEAGGADPDNARRSDPVPATFTRRRAHLACDLPGQLRGTQAPTARYGGVRLRRGAPRELRHSFVSLLSDADVPIERISRLVGHSSTTTTETIYRKQIRPAIVHGADVMDRIFPGERASDA